MRKLMWFAFGFAVAALFGTYWLQPDWYLPAAGISALVLAICLLRMMRLPKMRIAAMVSFAAVVGFLWILGYDCLFLSITRGYDDQTLQVTITATDYSYETEYGAATEGRVTLDGHSFVLGVGT